MAPLSRRALLALDDAFRAQLAPVLPAGVSPGEATAQVYSQLDGIVNERVAGGEEASSVMCEVAEQVLSTVQDRVARDIKTGWPSSHPGQGLGKDSSADLLLPGTEIVGDELRLWFGYGASPALVLEPIPLSILTEA